MSQSPHDALFRYTFGQPEHAAGLLRALLPRAAAEGLDFATVRVLPGTRLDRRLRRLQTDLLCAVRTLAGPELYVHTIIEHSSRVEPHMALRALDYSVAFWRQLVREGAKVLPEVVTIVVHHGSERWTAPTRFRELFDARGRKSPFTPRFHYVLQSLTELRPEEVAGLALTVLGKVTLAFLQFVPGASLPELAAGLRRWGGLVREVLAAPSGEEAMMALSEYVLSTTNLEQGALLLVVEHEVNRRANEIMETTAIRLRREGREEGREQGREQGRIELLTQLLERRFGPLPPAAHQQLAQATPREVAAYSTRVLEAHSLAEVLAPV